MKLEIGNFPIKSIQLGEKTDFNNGILIINWEYYNWVRQLRRSYRRKFTKEKNLAIVIIVLILANDLISYIKDNLDILIAIMIISIAGILCFIGFMRANELEKRRERIRRYNTIKSLLNRYRSRPTGFEKYVSDLFQCVGYKTQLTSRTNDGGKDIIMYRNGKKYVVEVKLYNPSNKIGRGHIQKLHSAMIDSNATEAIFVTTSSYTEPSMAYANRHGIQLMDGSALADLIDRVNNMDLYQIQSGKEWI
ncbi:MAG TPA: hypothetical protein GXX70_04710 [Tepidimicrobium sp.]|nr:hypothetical protein [Tepidimicrobium sp.]